MGPLGRDMALEEHLGDEHIDGGHTGQFVFGIVKGGRDREGQLTRGGIDDGRSPGHGLFLLGTQVPGALSRVIVFGVAPVAGVGDVDPGIAAGVDPEQGILQFAGNADQGGCQLLQPGDLLFHRRGGHTGRQQECGMAAADLLGNDAAVGQHLSVHLGEC